MSSAGFDLLRGHWLAACLSRKLKAKPIGVIILGTPIVLFRSTYGITALLDRCPHRNAALSTGSVAGGRIICPYHGWEFDQTGLCRKVPSLAGDADNHNCRVDSFGVRERHDLIWIRMAGPEDAPDLAYPVPGEGWDSFVWATTAACSLADGLENLLDAAHPYFVHRHLVRSTRRDPVPVTIRARRQITEVIYEENRLVSGLIPRVLEGRRTDCVARYLPPHIAQLEYRDAEGAKFLLTVFYTPVDERNLTVVAVLSTPRGLLPAWIKRSVLHALFLPVLRQDRKALKAQQWNIDRFGAQSFKSTPVDVLRRYIEAGTQGVWTDDLETEHRFMMEL